MCGLWGVDQAKHHPDLQGALRVRLRELSGSRECYGYRRLTVMLTREGSVKRVQRDRVHSVSPDKERGQRLRSTR